MVSDCTRLTAGGHCERVEDELLRFQQRLKQTMILNEVADAMEVAKHGRGLLGTVTATETN